MAMEFQRSVFLSLTLMVLILVAIPDSAAGQECQVEDHIPSVWLGDEADAFYCEAFLSNCSHFGLDYVCEDPEGGTATPPCENGTKVMCASPEAVPLAAPTPATTIRVVVYNVYEVRYLYFQNGQRERTCRTLHELFRLHQDIDVIVFNEVFMGGCFAKFNSSVETGELTMRDMLDQYGFIYYTDTVGMGVRETWPRFENGGVFIASRWPIVHSAERVFDESTFYSFIAKGVMYAIVNKTVGDSSMQYHIFGTHLQAFTRDDADGVRVKQAEIIHEFMLEQNIAKDEPVIYAGDLNAVLNSENGDAVFAALNASFPENVGELIYTLDPEVNDLLDEGDSDRKWIDYVLHSNDYLQPIEATTQIVRPRSSEPFDVCMLSLLPIPTYPDTDQCNRQKNITDLSDHFAVLGTFSYDQQVMTTPKLIDFTTGGSSRISSGWIMWVIMFLAIMCARI